MPLPWMHFRPASITSHFELSIMIGTRAISGSLAIRFRKRTIAALLSSIASSMLMSMTWAPFSTCWRATASASSNWPFRIRRANAFEPVTLVRSPMLTNSEPSPISTGSRPDSRIGGGTDLEVVSGHGNQAICVSRPAGRGSPAKRRQYQTTWGERRCLPARWSECGNSRLEPGSRIAVATPLEARAV